MQYYLEDTEAFTEQMIWWLVNKPETFGIKFNTVTTLDFPVELHFSDRSNVNVISEHRLLGVINVCVR